MFDVWFLCCCDDLRSVGWIVFVFLHFCCDECDDLLCFFVFFFFRTTMWHGLWMLFFDVGWRSALGWFVMFEQFLNDEECGCWCFFRNMKKFLLMWRKSCQREGKWERKREQHMWFQYACSCESKHWQFCVMIGQMCHKVVRHKTMFFDCLILFLAAIVECYKANFCCEWVSVDVIAQYFVHLFKCWTHPDDHSFENSSLGVFLAGYKQRYNHLLDDVCLLVNLDHIQCQQSFILLHPALLRLFKEASGDFKVNSSFESCDKNNNKTNGIHKSILEQFNVSMWHAIIMLLILTSVLIERWIRCFSCSY